MIYNDINIVIDLFYRITKFHKSDDVLKKLILLYMDCGIT